MLERIKNLTNRFQRSSGEAKISSDVSLSNERAPHLRLGQRGESLAAAYLERAGYRLVAANFTIPIGRNRRGALVDGEIDLIAYEGATLCFIEVKTRTSDDFAAPETAVDRRKQRQISRAARAYRRAFGLTGAPYRYDVISIVIAPREESSDAQTAIHLQSAIRSEKISSADIQSADNSSSPRIELLRNYWTDAKFRKRHWHDAPDDF
jgi:putative endonuclease